VTTRWLDNRQQRAWRTFMVGSIALMERLDRDLRERHGLSLPEYEVLVRLSESPDLSLRMAELAHSVSNSRSRMTHTVARLEREGLVVRRSCASDKRGVLAVLTEEGRRRLVAAAPDHVESVRTAVIDVISADDLHAIGRAFGEVLATLEATGDLQADSFDASGCAGAADRASRVPA
jgi:DNA-binding MarR family transcriptional regulator